MRFNSKFSTTFWTSERKDNNNYIKKGRNVIFNVTICLD